ncbi:MAG TPA: hypothetical protein VFZ91_06480 [Allosphingosinicella sp.]
MRHLLALVLFAAASPAAAQAVYQFEKGEAVEVGRSSAYLLFRTDARLMESWYEFVLVREDEAGEAAAAAPPRLRAAGSQPNVVRTDSGDLFDKSQSERFFLIAVPAGSYVVAAITYKRMPNIGTCLCMGTVRFEARAGAVTDLGYFLAALEEKPTAIPELAGFTDPATKYRMSPALAAMTVRPPVPGMPLPNGLEHAPIVAADYRAVGKFPNYFHTMINRMAPVRGVLAYDLDRAIDLKAGPR